MDTQCTGNTSRTAATAVADSNSAPWEVVIVGADTPESHYGVMDANGRKVALLSSRVERAEAEAFAHVIAAAPELLAAAKRIIRYYGPPDDYSEPYATWWSELDDAIAKAEGR